ncbi:hypothetical protein D8B26_003342 [Coccidioides posadasii str. Silveira]|uniref:uncharacterized protein n=1 Tax=Coccidioides posadasii (strain RMSCC 757 / Silveira) TaxID=443226 RepID=UPI001BEFE9EE|nr:hypothetical protein D8B26_003342 [Coccidioides posadasii str. Silveira]
MRFTAASVALFAGAALALPGYEQTVYSTREVIVTDCGPEVTDCPGNNPVPTGTGIPQEPAPTEYSTRYITVTDCGPEVTDCPAESTRTETLVPTGSDDSPTVPTENPPYPTGGNPGPSTSIVTYTTCIPTTTTSVVTLQPPVVPTGGVPTGGVPSQPTWQPTGGVPSAPSGSGVPPPPKGTTTSPPFEGAASTFGGSFAVAGLAAIAAVLFA